ncbi:MAG: 30S ribosomal protein S16 [Deltaproteobacteria bacterium]|nr:30S ribosomal protein S16 [Deltaproteobacteria bacterium]
MAVKIRLARHGAKKKPFYRIVVADSQYSRDGRFIEIVGTYDPMTEPVAVTFKNDRIAYWLDQGAIATDTVRSLLKEDSLHKASDPQEATAAA